MPETQEAILPTRPVAVIFDMDGLLFDSEALYRDAILAAARDLGHRFTAEDFLLLVGRPAEVNRLALQEHIGPAHDVEVFRAAWLKRYQVMKPTVALKPGVRELLSRLDQLGMARSICTSSGHEDVAEKLALHGLIGQFDAVVAAGDYEQGKPAPDSFLRAAAVLGVAPAACWALEDSHNGVRAAAAAGMQVIMVPDLLVATTEMRALCLRVAEDLHEVRTWLG